MTQSKLFVLADTDYKAAVLELLLVEGPRQFPGSRWTADDVDASAERGTHAVWVEWLSPARASDVRAFVKGVELGYAAE